MVDVVITEIDIQRYFVDLSKYVPDFLMELPEMKAVYNAEGRELARLNWQIQDILNQFNIDTATWGLRIYEDKYGLPYNPSLSYDERREMIKAARRTKGTSTATMIENAAAAFSGGEVKVIRHDEDSYFEIKFVGTIGVPKNIEAFIDTIEKIKPAHLGYKLVYTYNTYGDIKAHKWTYGELKALSHHEIRNGPEIRNK